MSKIDDGGLFFPIKNDEWNTGLNGISRRDWLAGLAMQGFCADPTVTNFPDKANMAKSAYQIADAMIAKSKENIDK